MARESASPDAGNSTSSGNDTGKAVVVSFLLGSAMTAVTATVVAAVTYCTKTLRLKEVEKSNGDDREADGCKSKSLSRELEQNNGGMYSKSPESSWGPINSAASVPQPNNEIIKEQQSRTALYFGDGMSSIRSARVAVVGVGGVGSHAAMMLARAGVGYLRIIDFDQVSLSSLNRHACATLADVGTPKVLAMERHFQAICGRPNSEQGGLRGVVVDARVAMFTEQDEETLLGGPDETQFDYIVDAIDDVVTKVQLLAFCLRNKIKVVSCMGAGGKSDVTRMHIGDLRGACHDPLATKIRLFLKRRGDVNVDSDDLRIVYSSEKTVAPLAELTEEQKSATAPGQYGAVDNMRVRVLPVLGTTPAIMGQACASHVLCELGGKSFSPLPGERMGRNVRHRIFQHLKNREVKLRNLIENQEETIQAPQEANQELQNEQERKGRMVLVGPPQQQKTEAQVKNDSKKNNSGSAATSVSSLSFLSLSPGSSYWVGPIQVDADDVEYLVAEVWRQRCAVTLERMGVVLELVRWDLSKPSNCNNLVLMSVGEIQKFDKMGRDGLSAEVRDRIEARLRWSKIDALA